MRHTRWLFLAAIVSILVFVGATYVKNKAELVKNAPSPPKPLETGLDGRADDWTYTKYDGDRKKVFVRAKEWKKVKDPSVLDLIGVELQLYHPDGEKFDLVQSEKVRFDIDAKTLFSEGETFITMGVKEDEPPKGRLLRIQSSGVSFSSDTGKATTDQMAKFEFDRGSGSAVGADYDPGTHEVHLRTKVALDWAAKTPTGKPMHAEAGEAVYHEMDSTVLLFPWSKLVRGTLVMDAGVSNVQLEQGAVRSAKLQMARGVQDDPGRKVEYAADVLDLDFAEGMVIHTIHADKNAHLVSTAHTTQTTVNSDHLDMDFAVADKESTLANAVATGKSRIEAAPLTKPGAQPADTRILNSETIRMAMRPGGEEIDRVETDGPGTLDFVPNRPDQPKRNLRGDRIWIAYGLGNHIQSFRSVNATTRTEKPAQAAKAGQPAKPAPPPTLTKSKDILATFDPNTSELARLEQNGDFTYEEGDRHAQADRASMDQAKDVITLNGSARAQDPSGAIRADQIVMSQKSNDYQAEGHVTSVREPDRKGASSAMLSNDEVMKAQADRMTTSGGNKKVHYEGHATAYQAANRVTADKIDIDRDGKVMEAHGNVVSEFTDKASAKSGPDKVGSDKEKGKDKQAKSKPASAPQFTVVRASDLIYTDETRIALYQGGVHLDRPGSGLTVDSQQLKAYLKTADSDSSLDKAFADGSVKIISILTPSATAKNKEKRTRTGTSGHAEYYADDQKVIMREKRPVLEDNVRGRSEGDELTLFTNDDRLLVDGKAETSLHKKQ